MRHRRFDDEDEGTSLVGDALYTPISLLVGFITAATVALLTFGLVWWRTLPSSIEAMAEGAVLLATVALVSGAFGALFFGVRPITRFWHVGVLVAAATVAATYTATLMRDILLSDCLRGTGPQEFWCDSAYSFTPFYAWTAFAGIVNGLLFTAFGVKARAASRRSRSTRGT